MNDDYSTKVANVVGFQFPQAARQQWRATFLAVLGDSAETLASCSRRIAAWKRPIRLTRPTMMVTDELTMRSTMRRTMNPPGKMRLWNHLPTTSPWKVTRMAKWPKLWHLSCSSSRRAMARERERVRAPLALPPSLFPFKSADGISFDAKAKEASEQCCEVFETSHHHLHKLSRPLGW